MISKLISFNLASRLAVVILLLACLFNISVMLELFSYKMVWGGRITSYQEMIKFELVSIVISLLSVALIAMRSAWILPKWRLKTSVLIWILPVFNFLGILGNAVSKSDLERAIFLPVAIIMFLLTLRIAVEKASDKL